MIMLFTILSSILLVAESKRRLTATWGAPNPPNPPSYPDPTPSYPVPDPPHPDPEPTYSSDDDHHHDSSDYSSSHRKQYVKGYVKCIKGQINMWYGGHSKLPYGWNMCDGTHGTPDLRGRFPIGADGDKFPYWSTGGREEVTLTEAELPTHQHNICEKDMHVSTDGRHTHWNNAHMSENGTHWHNQGDLRTQDAGEHDHDFETHTQAEDGGLDGAHVHYDIDLHSRSAGDHNHGMNFESQLGGSHDHAHDIEVVDDEGIHKHKIFVKIADDGAHRHHYDIKDITIDIPPHVHGVGNYSAADHVFTHHHNVSGQAGVIDGGGSVYTDDGIHKHNISITSKYGGYHNHNFTQGYAEHAGTHSHDSGTLYAQRNGDHVHYINESTTEPGEEHNHSVNAYFECTWGTTDCDWDLAMDKVDKTTAWEVHTETEVDIEQTVPAQNTVSAGAHNHTIGGSTASYGDHWHTVNGAITWNNGHFHEVIGESEEDGEHIHHVEGEAAEIETTLHHHYPGEDGQDGETTFFGYSGLAGATTATVDGDTFWTTDSGEHNHTGYAWMNGDDGTHNHNIQGGISKYDSYGNPTTHTHTINGDTEINGTHYHYVNQGTVGNNSVDGIHYHRVNGTTEHVGNHSHGIYGYVGFSGSHLHNISCQIYAGGEHNHSVSGITKHAGEGEPFNILPPYFSVHFICCTAKYGHYHSHSSDSPDGSTWNNDVPPVGYDPQFNS